MLNQNWRSRPGKKNDEKNDEKNAVENARNKPLPTKKEKAKTRRVREKVWIGSISLVHS